MCGIVGFLSPESVPSGLETLEGMNRQLHHRGPDQDGLFLSEDGRVGLGHKRLSIIDLTHGRQPMTDRDGILTLIFNGEIYNHNALRAELQGKGHPIASRSDTETLLYAYKEWGEDCLSRLRGMFAFAVYDRRDGSVFLARDRIGIKPLYYGRHGNALVFGSECKAILAWPGFDRALDPEAVSDFFSLMYVPAPKSVFKRIRKLPAGHWMRVRADGSGETARYWDLEFPEDADSAPDSGYAAAKEELAALLEDCVGSHMESDVPMGAFLSGGVDSSAVVALMARRSAQPVITNTIGFPEQAYDETAFARETAALFRTDHKEHRVVPDSLGVLEKLAWHYDEPFADSSMVPTYYVCQMARKNVTVALSGDGGDESFAGYRRYAFDVFENGLRRRIPAPLRRPLFGALGSLYPKFDWLPRPLRAKTLLTSLSLSPVEGYFRTMSHFQPAMKARLFSDGFKAALGGYDSLSVFEEHWANCRSRDPLSRVQYLDVKTYLAEDILTKVDRASMAVSLEVRVPLLDHKLMEFAARLPSRWKLRGGKSKLILKDSLRSVLPDAIFSRPKSGFSMPIKEWFRESPDTPGGPLARLRLPDTGLFDGGYLDRLWSEHRSGARDHSFPLFALLAFGHWHERFVAGKE